MAGQEVLVIVVRTKLPEYLHFIALTRPINQCSHSCSVNHTNVTFIHSLLTSHLRYAGFYQRWRLFPTTGDTAAYTSMFWAKCQILKCHREQRLHIKGINRHRLFYHCGRGVKILWNIKSLRPFLKCVQMQGQDVSLSLVRAADV